MRPADRKKRSLQIRLGIAGASLALLTLLWLASRSVLVMDAYLVRLYPQMTPLVGSLAGLFPFSLAEWLLLTGLIILAAFGIRAIWRLRRGSTVGWLLGNFVSWTLALGLPLLAFGYLNWGLLYDAPQLEARAGWVREAVSRGDPIGELLQLCKESIDLTNANYQAATGSADMGEPSESGQGASSEELDTVLETGLRRAAPLLGLVAPAAVPPSKAIHFSGLLSHLGIAGFYSPWTAEANYNRLVPACSRVHAIAHEKAHQFGLAREDEANFAGFLACIFADEPYARYSGYLFAQNQLLSEVARRRPEAWKELASGRLPGVERDVRNLRRFWQNYEGRATRVGRTVNDSYLKLQGIEEGIESYRQSVRFLVLFSRSNGGSLQPPAG